MSPRLAALGLAFVAFGCAKKPYAPEPCMRPDLSGCVVDELKVTSGRLVPEGDVKEKVATTETSRVFWGVMEHVPILSIWDRLTLDYSKLDPVVLERDLARVERYYRARGYYEAHARAARLFRRSDDHLTVEIVVEEGPVVRAKRVVVRWKDWAPSVSIEATRAVDDEKSAIKEGAPFDEDTLELAKKKIVRALTDRGYAYANVGGSASVDLVSHEASVELVVELGPLCQFGKIDIVDNGDLPESKLRYPLELDRVKEGKRFSTARLDEAQIDLAALNVFRAIDIKPQLSAPGAPRNPVIPVTISAPPRQLGLVTFGAGAELGNHAEVHGVVRWEHHNVLGGLRYMSVDAKPGFVIYPTRIDTLFSQRPTNILPQITATATFRQPYFPESLATDFVTNLQVAIYRPESASSIQNTGGYVPRVFGANSDKLVYIPAEDNILGYRQYSAKAGFERRWLKTRVTSAIYYNAQLYSPFSYNLPDVPDGYRSVTVLFPQASVEFDFRRNDKGKPDKLRPHSGTYASLETQLAFGGDVRDLRIRPDFRFYLPVSKTWTVAARLSSGLLFPFNYGQSLDQTTPCTSTAGPAALATCNAIAARDQQLLQLRAFFSGGPSSNRGYPYNGVGPQDVVTFLTPNANQGDVIAAGGLTLWEASLELRVPFGDTLGLAWFLDGSDVTRRITDLRLTVPHLSTGLGLRYQTPVGPFRFDLGYRIPGLQKIGVPGDVPASEGTAGTVFGLPIAVNLAIGESF